LTVAGMYVFQVSVSDGTNTSSKKVYLMAFASNPPPILGQAGFRFNPPYGLVFTDPGDTTHANVELPTSSAILQVGIGDLANDLFYGRGLWKLVSEPASANAFVDTTTYIYVSIRAKVSVMTVPGDYVFQCNVTNPGHPDLTCRVICTVHPASSGPVINSIYASPASPTLPADSTMLSARTIDTSGQLLRYWWAIKSVPAGAKPVFDHQGLANSNVSGLTVPGTYTFTLRAFDDIHETTKDFSFAVNKPSGGVSSPSAIENSILCFPNPVSNALTVQYIGEGSGIVRVTVANLLGQIVRDENVLDNAAEITFPMDGLPPGIYLLSIEMNGHKVSKKIVKQ